MAKSIFEQRIPTLERPSIIVDRVLETILELGDQELLDFFSSGPGAGTGDNIRILLRPDPVIHREDPIPGLFLWGLSQGRGLLIGGADFSFTVGFRMAYESPSRFRDSGKPDAGNLPWKLRRALWKNKTLVTNLAIFPLPGDDPQADHMPEFRAVEFQDLPAEDRKGCFDVIEGDFTYEKEIGQDDI